MSLALNGTTGIVSANIQNGTITGSDIATSTITGSNIATSTITGSNIANNTITYNKLSPAINVCSAYLSTPQTINNASGTKVQINAVYFDTGSFFNVSTYRFTPTVAGYYNIYGQVGFGTSGAGQRVVAVYKNGTPYRGLAGGPAISGATTAIGGSALVSLNGTGDYAEIFAFQDSTASQLISNAYFDAYLVRGL